LLSACREKGIFLSMDDAGMNLKIRGNVEALSEEEVHALRSFKQEILGFLKQTAHHADPIPYIGERPGYELSSAQQRIWVLSQLAGGELAYHITLTNVFEGVLHEMYLGESLDQLIGRHQSLRTVFRENESGEIRQYILDTAEIDLSITSIDLRKYDDKENVLKNKITQSRSRAFHLEEGPLLRACLYRISDRQWVFDVVMHHIISDGWSMDILIRELLMLYQARCKRVSTRLPPLSIRYVDYAAWQQSRLQHDHRHRDYWLRQFEGELPVLQLPGDYARPSAVTYNGHRIETRMDKGHVMALKTLVREQGCTLFMGLLALINALLFRYTSQHDIVIGSPIAGREQGGLEEQVGLYMNTLALRTGLTHATSFIHLLAEVRETVLGAYAHQAYPFDALVEALHIRRDKSHHPLFDIMMAFRQDEAGDLSFDTGDGRLEVAEYRMTDDTPSKFDIFFNFIDQAGELRLQLTFNTDIYKTETIRRMAGHLERLLAAVLNEPASSLTTMDYLSKAEKEQLLVAFNDTRPVYPACRTVVDLFEEQAIRTPDVTAVVSGETSLTYGALNRKTNQLACYLTANNTIVPDMPVAVLLDRSAEMIIALLGILRSGAAYLPLDPDYPQSRIDYLLKDAEAEILLTTTQYLPRLSAYRGQVIAIDAVLDAIDICNECSGVRISPSSLAYIIYTSGSTGAPKGVMISHASLVDYCFGVLNETNMRDCRHFGVVSTIAADLGNTVIFPALLTGGTLHIYPAADLLDGERIFESRLDCIKIVPSHWNSLQTHDRIFLPQKCLIFGGEQLTADVLGKIKGAGHTCQVYNHYGPSETTVGKLIGRLDPNDFEKPIPLGRPFCDASVYILDDLHALVPVGVTGEICISGAGVARGYLHKPGLTAEKFVADPFHKDRRMYKTGDLGRWLPDGRIVFIGRKDQQVKIRGFRIELGEIEAAIRRYAPVSDTVVTATLNSEGETALTAYLVSRDELQAADIRSHLAAILPVQMIPAHFIQIDRIPLTLNGKIDRKALPGPEGAALPTGTAFVAPRNETESKLVSIWRELLGDRPVGIKDNFFELGGHSLKIMQMVSRINRTFSIKLNIQSIFKQADIEHIGEQISFMIEQRKQKDNKKNLIKLEI